MMASLHPLPFHRALLAMVGISLVNMLVALDQTVVSTTLPSIVAELRGFDYYAWVATAYLLCSVVAVPVFGRLGDYFGRKRFVIAAVLTFTTASLLCGLAANMLFLVFARGLQGIGGGMMVGTAFASIPDLFPSVRARVRWQVVMATAYGIGTAVGPSLGGWLSQQWGWRSTFLINLPVGAAALYFIWKHLPNFHRPRASRVYIDWLGALLIAFVLVSLQLLIEALPKHGLTTPVGLLSAGLLLGTWALWICERRAAYPIVPLDLFKDRQLVALFTLSLLAGFVMFSLIFFAPLLLQGGFDLSPRQAGLIATPIAACIAVGSLLNARIVVHLTKPTRILTTGFCLLFLASIALIFESASTGHLWLEIPMAAIGIGLGFILNNLNVFAQEIAGRERFGITTALLQSTRMVGGMLGTSIVGAVVSHHYRSVIARTVGMLEGGAMAFDRLADLRALLDTAFRDQLLIDLRQTRLDGTAAIEMAREALIQSIHLGMALIAALALAAILLTNSISHIVFKR